MLKQTAFVFLAVLTYLSGHCQETPDVVNLMNGQSFEGTLVDTANGLLKLRVPKKNKTRLYTFEQYRVFSYTQGRQPEMVLYRQDTAIGNFLTQTDMRYFFLGEKDARRRYNPVGTKIMASLLTLGVSLADTYYKDSTATRFTQGFFKSDPGVITLVAPLLATTIALLPAVQLRIDKVSDKSLLNHQAYLDGFEKIARSKRVFGALKFSVLGCLAGVASYYIFR